MIAVFNVTFEGWTFPFRTTLDSIDSGLIHFTGKLPFTCKEVPSNSVPIEKVEPADNKEDKGVSRLKLPYSLDIFAMQQGTPLDKNNIKLSHTSSKVVQNVKFT